MACTCVTFLFMATQAVTTSSRAVVLLKPSERKKLERLAASQKASSGEILRRSLRAYEPEAAPEDEALLIAMLAEMNTALDRAIESIRSARIEIRENLDNIAKIRAAAL